MASARETSWQPKNASVQELIENESNIFKKACKHLLSICDAILNDPKNVNARNVKLAENDVAKNLLPANGGIVCLFEMGFVEGDDCLTLPIDADLSALRHIRDEITAALKCYSHTENAEDTVVAGSSKQNSSQQTVYLRSPGVNQKHEQSFLNKLQVTYNEVLIYEDKALQEKALSCVPLRDILEHAKDIASENGEMDGNTKAAERDFLIIALLDWFKKTFFSWVDTPKCTSCKTSSTFIGPVQPLPSELKWGGTRVEVFSCNSCQKHLKFVRYQHPEKLLETRSGRCGEWANCFTLICIALGFEARYVLDWTDHVWTEVYSEEQQRWLHCDPCENVCDKPLLYEKGWGKKLTYVIAFSKNDVQDVTWRYSKCHSDTLGRRLECRENWLAKTIVKMRDERQKLLPPTQQKILLNRCIAELIELLTENSSNERLQGRTTGSVAWRHQRGELGSKQSSVSFTFSPTEDEIRRKCMKVCYSSSSDTYVRGSNDKTKIKGWRTCVLDCENMMRKVENDWKMAYLARVEDSPTSSITWKFDFVESGLVINDITILASSACYENGKVKWILCSDNTCIPLKGDGFHTIRDLAGFTSVKLTAHLQGGKGDNAWQHTQLFRQSLESADFPLDITITLKTNT